MVWQKPETAQIQAALRRYAPALADEPIEPLGEGWGVWTFRVGDYVLRFPKRERETEDVTRDARIWRELSQQISTPISVPDLFGQEGPNGAPFAGHRYISGVSLISAVKMQAASARKAPPPITLSASFGRDLGRFIRQVQGFSPERAVELGVPLRDGPEQRASVGRFYEDVIRNVFPLVNCEVRTNSEQRFEAYLNEPRNFDFEPRLIHHDLDRQNVLIDAENGNLAGVVDWGDAVVGNPAIDLWLPLIDFVQLGIGEQLEDCLDAYGPFDRERAQVQVEFTDFLWPFHDILYGLRIGDEDFVEGGIRDLSASAPGDIRCD